MDSDFHYFGTGTAAVSSGFDRADSQVIAFSAQFVDWFASEYKKPWQIVNENGKPAKNNGEPWLYLKPQISVQSISAFLAWTFDDSIWIPFHFPPGNLAYHVKTNESWQHEFQNKHVVRKTSGFDKESYKLCRPYSKFALDMMLDTVDQFRALSKLKGKALAEKLEKILGPRKRCPVNEGRKLALYLLGVRMHILGDTWAHQDFAGEQNKINGAGDDSPMVLKNKLGRYEKVDWEYSLYSALERTDFSKAPDWFVLGESAFAGHSQIGSFPDYSWVNFRYHPAWLPKGTRYLERDNPAEYEEAWSWMQFVMGLCCGAKTGADLPETTPKKIVEVIQKQQPMGKWGSEAFAASESCWEKTDLVKQFVNPVFNNFNADDWPKLDKAKLGLHDESKSPKRVYVRRESVLHYMELASALHYQFYYNWVQKHKEYKPVKPRALLKPVT